MSHVLAKLLSADQKREISRNLAENLAVEENVTSLVEVLDLLEADDISYVSDATSKHIIDLLKASDDITGHLKLLSKLPSAFNKVLQWVYAQIVFIIFERQAHLVPEAFSSLLSTLFTTSAGIPETELPLKDLTSTLSTLISLENAKVTIEVENLVLILISINAERVSDTAAKALRWVNLSQNSLHTVIMEIVSLLLESETKYHITNGFILWLRFLLSLQKTQTSSKTLDEKIVENKYWRDIQAGLISSVHEHKKYSLSILKLSIQINHLDFDNDYIQLREHDSNEHIESWKKFSTLYEIIGIDTAINQTEAAWSDIIELLSLKSPIKPSWGLTLLSVGFKGSMESVKKFSLKLMYNVPKEDLPIFNHEFLTTVFLKYAIEAHHFNVKESRGQLSCEYGERLENFVKQLLQSLKHDADAFRSTGLSILSLLVDNTTVFAPARIYLSSGLLKGLKGTQLFTVDQTQAFLKLFGSKAEDELFETYLQSIHLLLLTHIKSDTVLLLDLITKFVQINGYEIFRDNQEVFLDYLATYHDKSQDLPVRREMEYQVVLYTLFQDETSSSDEFLKELAFSGIDISDSLKSKFSELLTSLLSLKTEDFTKSSSLVDLSIFKNSWRTVQLKPLYESVAQDKFDLEKLKLFTRAYAKVTDSGDNGDFLDFESLVSLESKLTSVETNFKTRDVITGEYQSLILSFLKVNPISDEQLELLLKLIQRHLAQGFHHGYRTICHTIQYLLSNYPIDPTDVVDILKTMWDHITSERLVLGQKDMHISLIETLYHETLLKDSINNEFNAKILLKIGYDIVSQAFTRRSLLPALSSKLLQYSTAYTQDFEQTEWLIELILIILCLIQDETHLFKIKNLIASKFDNEISYEGSLYTKIYGAEEVSTKINIISILSLSSPTFATLFFQKLLTAEDKFHLIKPKKKADGTEELQRIYAFSSILLISKKVSPVELTKAVRELLLPSLANEVSPLVRVYLEWIISIDLINSSENRGELFNYFLDQNKPTLVSSVERIAVLVAAHISEEERANYFQQFTIHLIPNCSSNKPLIRHFSNSLILTLYPLIKDLKVDLPVESVLEMLFKEAKKSEITGKFRSGDALFWDALEDFNLTSIFGGVLAKVSPRQAPLITAKSFKKYIKQELPVPIGSDGGPVFTAFEDSNEKDGDKPSNSPLQTKSGAWETVLDLDEKSRSVKRSDLIVVSSLVNKPPNLGGICRLCDVLGAGLMTVDDLRVKNHPQFKNVAVTADYWMPMVEVKIDGIVDYMLQKKKEGYTLIGLEQTDKSIVLGKDTPFPPKSLILLGKEAEGIPGPLLAELDYCIEIRQQGVIRSMNIQTATAVIVHAYASAQ